MIRTLITGSIRRYFADPGFKVPSKKVYYHLKCENGTDIRFSYGDFSGVLEFSGRQVFVKPVLNFLTIKRFSIVEHDVVIGHIGYFNGIKLGNDIFKCHIKNIQRKGFWNFFRSPVGRSICLSGAGDIRYLLEYRVQEGMPASKLDKSVEGHIDSPDQNLLLPLLGLFIFEFSLTLEAM